MIKQVLMLVYVLAGALPPAIAFADRTVHVYNWSDYIAPDLLDEFTRETGIRVVYDTYDSNETLETKLMAGRSGYDIVFPSGSFLQRQIKTRLYQPLDRARLTNSANISSEIDAFLASYDPGLRYSVPYMWFTTGIAYNVEKMKSRLGGSVIDSWDIVLNPENLRKVSDCGVYVLDSPEDIFSIGLRYMRLNADSKNPADYLRVSGMLQKLRPFIKKYHSSEYIAGLAGGDVCLAIGWTGDAFQARNRARESGSNIELNYVIPKEGSLLSLDVFAIPVEAKNVTEAYAFIDYLLRPESAQKNTNVTNFANGVNLSKQVLAPEIMENKSIYLDTETMKKLYTISPPDLALQRMVTREWTRIKSGR